MSGRHLALTLILAGSFCIRLYHIDAPLLDGMSIKQLYVAHKARGIAGPPFDLRHNSFDFLGDDNRRLVLTEEAPLYTGLLALGYRVVGEADWLGRLLSSFAMLLATATLYDLMRRDLGGDLALPAAAAFAFSPLLLCYGQAVQPDSCMLAGMLLAACCWSRYLDSRRWRWWLAAAACGATAALFKYYALMVLLPLVHTQLRRDGWRALASLPLLGVLMAAPVGLWMAMVFLATPNPTVQIKYFLFQMPELLWQRPLYERFLDRFLAKDCGPAMCGVLLLGFLAGLLGRLKGRRIGPIWDWTMMALGFYFLMGPMLRCHDYYEMMMMPAAAGWAAFGWDVAARSVLRSPVRQRWGLALGIVTLAVVHSPWVTRGKFDCDTGLVLAAQRVSDLSSPGSRVIVIGPDNGMAIVHYAKREGWTYFDTTDLRGRLLRGREHGAEYAVIYVNHFFKPPQRSAIITAARELPAAEHATGRWAGRDVPGEYFLIRLSDLEPALSAQR